jgi:hypothetical protein
MKTPIKPQTSEPKSSCCGAKILEQPGIGGTAHLICRKCWEPTSSDDKQNEKEYTISGFKDGKPFKLRATVAKDDKGLYIENARPSELRDATAAWTSHVLGSEPTD